MVFRLTSFADAVIHLSMAMFFALLVFVELNAIWLYYLRIVYASTSVCLWFRLFEWTSLF